MRDEHCECALLRAVGERWPPVDIKIACAHHVARIYFAGVRIQEIIGDKHFVPRVDEVDVDIICHLKVTVHAQETSDTAIDRVVESIRIETVDARIAQEILVLACGHVRCGDESRRKLVWSTATTTADEVSSENY